MSKTRHASAEIRARLGHPVIDGDGHIVEYGPTYKDCPKQVAGSRIVHDIVASMGGSISAEHGLGAMKTEEARRYKSPVEIEALAAIRRALDPKRIMNPRVLF